MPRRVPLTLSTLVLALLLSACTPTLAFGGTERNLLIIGWDGYDRAHLETQLAAGELPELEALMAAGSYWPLQIEHRFTNTKPGWAGVMAGVNPESLGIAANWKSQPIPDGMTIFEQLRADDPEITIGWYVAKLGNAGLACNADPETVTRPFYNLCDDIDAENVNPDNHIDNDLLAQRAMAFIEDSSDGRFAAFVLFGTPDWAGHYCERQGDGSNPGYFASVASTPDGGATGCPDRRDGEPDIFWGYGTDYWTGQIIDLLERLGLRDDTLVVVTTDHGFDPREIAHCCRYPDVWMVASEPMQRIGNANLYAITPSILNHLSGEEDEQD